MKRIACQIALLALALPLAACNERPRNDDGPKNVAPKGKEPAGASGKTKPAKTEKPAARVEGEAIEILKAVGAAIRLDGEGNVIVVQIRDGKATDATAKLLVAMKSLKDLQLSGEKVTDAAIDSITRLDKLKVLKLDATSVGDAGLEKLESMVSLEQVYLSGTKITDAGLAHLAALPRLRRLRISDTQVTGEGMRHLKSAANLADLDVSKTGVDDGGWPTSRRSPP